MADHTFTHLQTAGCKIKNFNWNFSKGKDSVTFSSFISFVLVFEAWDLAGQNSPYLEEQSLPGVKDSSRPGRRLTGSQVQEAYRLFQSQLLHVVWEMGIWL